MLSMGIVNYHVDKFSVFFYLIGFVSKALFNILHWQYAQNQKRMLRLQCMQLQRNLFEIMIAIPLSRVVKYVIGVTKKWDRSIGEWLIIM